MLVASAVIRVRYSPRADTYAVGRLRRCSVVNRKKEFYEVRADACNTAPSRPDRPGDVEEGMLLSSGIMCMVYADTRDHTGGAVEATVCLRVPPRAPKLTERGHLP
jgi:hypothetical protein